MFKWKLTDEEAVALIFIAVLGITVLGMWGSWDRQPMGEPRTEAQARRERGD